MGQERCWLPLAHGGNGGSQRILWFAKQQLASPGPGHCKSPAPVVRRREYTASLGQQHAKFIKVIAAFLKCNSEKGAPEWHRDWPHTSSFAPPLLRLGPVSELPLPAHQMDSHRTVSSNSQAQLDGAMPE
ncbi:Transcriptional Regulator Kaiso [Manis pentadactyla]|nr:Transcriptional Regulator Kaiso [Manis pentadactyla]